LLTTISIHPPPSIKRPRIRIWLSRWSWTILKSKAEKTNSLAKINNQYFIFREN
jgi:hypothetical protein